MEATTIAIILYFSLCLFGFGLVAYLHKETQSCER